MISLTVVDIEIKLPQTVNGQGWIKDVGAVAIVDQIDMTWGTVDGKKFNVSIPYRQLVPNHSRDDFVIEIDGPGSVETRLARLAK